MPIKFMSQKQNNDDKITKIGICSPESTAYDSTFAEDFINYLSNNKEVKTLTWFEYESL